MNLALPAAQARDLSASFENELKAHGIDTERLFASLPQKQHSPFLLSLIVKAGKLFLKPKVAHQSVETKIARMKEGLARLKMKQNIGFSFIERELDITQLALATLIGDEATVQAVLSKCPPNDQDAQGYTACHMAAMTDRVDLLGTLYINGGTLSKPTREGLTVVDILKARGFGLSASKSGSVTVRKDEPLPMSEVKAVTGRDYLPDCVYSTDALFALWSRNLRNSTLSESASSATYCKIKEGAHAFESPVYIRQIPAGHPLEGQWELVALRDIREGEFVIEYTAYVDLERQQFSHYAMSSKLGITFDAKEGGSFAEIANHGLPNCIVTEVIHKGLEHSILTAICPIQAGTAIRINYGAHYFQNGKVPVPFKEISGKEIETFVRDSKELADFTIWEDASTPSYDYAQELKEYLFEFPDHLFCMVKENKLSRVELINFLLHCHASGFERRLGLHQGYSADLLREACDSSLA